MLNFNIKTLEKYQGNVIEPNIQADYFISPCFKVVSTVPTIEYYKATKEQFNPKTEAIDENGIVQAKPVDVRALDYIQTTIGRLKKQTPVGDLPTVMNSLCNLVNIAGVLPAGTLRFYNEDETHFYNADMTKEEFSSLFLEFINAYKAMDINN